MPDALWTPPSGARPAAAPRPRAEPLLAFPDEPIVELMDGITLHRSSILRIRRLSAALFTALVALSVQIAGSRDGWALVAPPSPAPAREAAAGPEARAGEAELLARFSEARARMADLIRLGSVLPPAAIDVQAFSLSDPAAGPEVCLRITGVETEAGAAREYAATIGAVMPATRLDVDAPPPSASPARPFGIAGRFRSGLAAPPRSRS